MNASITLDINCDLGEGLSNDAALMPYLGSCNIACGGHAGDRESILQTLAIAKKHKVMAGAHPSYPDILNFGRKVVPMAKDKLYQSILKQIQLFSDCCKEASYPMHHVKAHGALYNQAAKDTDTAEVLTAVMTNHFPNTPLYCPPGSVLLERAKTVGLTVVQEAFADRAYREDLSLVSRDLPGAVLHDPRSALEQVLNISAGFVKTDTGKRVPIEAQTICIHGDNPNALDILKVIFDYSCHDPSKH